MTNTIEKCCRTSVGVDEVPPQPHDPLTRDDALRLWDVMASTDQRATFGQMWDAVQAVRDHGDTGPFVKFAESLSVMALAEKEMPGTYLEMRAASHERPSIPEHMLQDLKAIIGAAIQRHAARGTEVTP